MFVNVNGVRLRAVSFGDGPRTLVAVGGWTGSWELWEQPFELLSAAAWRCIGYDHRGAGESPVEPDLITIDAMTDDVGAVLDALGVGTCILAGESSGGAVVRRAVAAQPARFGGLVLVDTAVPSGSDGPFPFADECRADYPAAVQGFMERCVPEPDSDHIRRWGRSILLRAGPDQAARLIEAWRGIADVDPGAIDVPTLLIHGADDQIVPLADGLALAERLRDVEVLVLDGIGHVPTMTAPHDVAAAIDRRFPAVGRTA